MPASRRTASQLTRPQIKQILLWSARMLASADGTTPYPGSIKVEVIQVDEAEAVMVKPHRGLDGMEPPEGLRVAEGSAVPVSELLRAFLSPDERRLLADLGEHQPCSATSVADRLAMRKSAFWELWGNLQQRGLVVQGDDEQYRLGPEWLGGLLGTEGKGRPAG